MKKYFLSFPALLSLGLLLLFSLLHLWPAYERGDLFLYDIYLNMTPGPEEDDRLVLLNIDDLGIAEVGMFPWSRSIMADGLILMKEMGVRHAVFDIEYTEDSPMALNTDFLNEDMPELLSQEFRSINDNMQSLFNALAAGQISLEDAGDYIMQLEDLNENSRQILQEKLNSIARDNDVYFGKTARLFEHAVFTVNLLKEYEEQYDADHKAWTAENMQLPVEISENSLHPEAVDIRPTIAPIMTNGMAAGFTNVEIDSDGVRRRVDLLAEYEDSMLPQLSMAIVYQLLGQPQLELSKQKLIMKDAQMSDGTVTSIEVPLDKNGQFLINWPRGTFEESFTHFSYYALVRHREQEDSLIHNLRIMQDAGYLDYYEGDIPLMRMYDYAEGILQDMLEGGSLDAIEEYREIRSMFFIETEMFFNGEARRTILDQIDAVLASENISDEQHETYGGIRKSVVDSFDNTSEILELLLENRRTIAENLNDSICYIGWTGTATTDIGVNPFDSEYDNVGTHAAIANTLLQQDFIDILPLWLSILTAAAMLVLYYRLQRNLTPIYSILTGLGFVALLFSAGWILFRFQQLYLPLFTPLLTLSAAFISLTVMNFLSTAREKNFIRGAFGKYLSNDVIENLIENPDKLNLGGEKRILTALFTDIKGFSTISETLDPADLVKLLNMYLTEMSDTILNQRGTIDKFEGDAIIAFFGAPVAIEDHPTRACLSAIQIKRAEALLNERIKEEKLSDYPLQTRIGINTGEIVVGNMGTARKMDYTIMGNAVNLAARLEGVNKRYGTWLLMSEAVYNAGGNQFAARRLDRVRVVGINTPVRLYELVEENDRISETKQKVLDLFDQGLSLSEERDWKGASELFQQVLDLDPEDGPALHYLERCRRYAEEPPKEDWDGVFNLTEK